MPSEVLITGATGHVGSVLAQELVARGLHLRALIRDPRQHSIVERYGAVAEFADLTLPASLLRVLSGIDTVVHAAAYLGKDPHTAYAVNLDGTRNLVQASLECGVRRFVHISSVSVNGDPLPVSLHEESPIVTVHEEHPYVASKAKAELVVRQAQDHGLETVILRPGAICAAERSQWGDEIVAHLATQGWPPDIHPDDIIPWTHTFDLAGLCWLALTHSAATNETFLAVDRDIAYRDYYVPLARALGQDVTPPSRAPFVTRSRIGKAAKILGYRTSMTFEETLDELLELAHAWR